VASENDIMINIEKRRLRQREYQRTVKYLEWRKKYLLVKGEKGKSDTGYVNLHQWVSKNLGKPDTCQHCKESGLTGHKIQWANKSHKYKKDLKDWIRLCGPCHKIYDGLTV
jgi:hypothetical protein